MSNTSNNKGPHDLNAYSDDIQRMAKLSPEECEKELEAVAEKHGVSPSQLKMRIKSAIAANKKAARQQEKDARAKAAKASGYVTDVNGNIKPTMTNIGILFDNSPDVSDILYFDDHSSCPMMKHAIGHPDEPVLLVYGDDTEREFPHRLTDDDVLALLKWTQRHTYFTDAKITELRQAIDERIKRTRRNPVIEWLDSLKWDGVSRVNKVLINYLGAPCDRRSVAAGLLLMLSLVARITRPGCKQDYSLLLKTPQGSGKSEVTEALAIKEEYFTDNLDDLKSRDAQQMIEGIIVAELGEHFAANKHDANATKAALSRKRNHYVPKYKTMPITVKRTNIFISTTNDVQMLADQTGNRRWVPITCCVTREQIDVAGLKADLPQLYAEAYTRLKRGQRYWPSRWVEKHYFLAAQEERRIRKNWETIFRDYMRTIEGLNGVDVIDTPNIGIPDTALALFFETCERFKAVLSTEWMNVLEHMDWEYKRHRLRGRGRDHRPWLWARKGSADVIDYTLGWKPQHEHEPGKWRREVSGYVEGEEITLATYVAEEERLSAEVVRACLAAGAWRDKRPTFADDD